MVGGEFLTEWAPPLVGFRELWRWRRQHRRIVRQHRRRGEALPNVSPKAGQGLRDAYDSVTWTGHAGVAVRLDKRLVLCDPNWSSRIALIVKRLTPPAPAWGDLPPVDLVTISHNHYDHLDLKTLRRLRSTARFLVPGGLEGWFRRRGFERVHEFDWWQTRRVDGLRATFVPSQHFSGRTLRDRNRTRWGGWVLEGQRHRVYHAGDTGYFDGFREIGRRFPRLDVACLPIGAYEPRWFMSPVHVDPDEAGRAFLDIGAKNLLPIHWGTFRLADEAMDDPPHRIRAFFRRQRLAARRLWLPDLGQTVRLPS